MESSPAEIKNSKMTCFTKSSTLVNMSTQKKTYPGCPKILIKPVSIQTALKHRLTKFFSVFIFSFLAISINDWKTKKINIVHIIK